MTRGNRLASDGVGNLRVKGQKVDRPPQTSGKDVRQRPERVIRRQGLDVEEVERRGSDAAFTQNLDERRLVNDRSARGIAESGRWLHCLQLGRSDQALRPLAEDQVDPQDVSVPEEFLPGDQPRSARLRPVRRQFWLQAITFMSNASPMPTTSEPILPRPRKNIADDIRGRRQVRNQLRSTTAGCTMACPFKSSPWPTSLSPTRE
jgi:hypothetical protein